MFRVVNPLYFALMLANSIRGYLQVLHSLTLFLSLSLSYPLSDINLRLLLCVYAFTWRHDYQHSGTQHNITKYRRVIMLNAIMLSVAILSADHIFMYIF